MLKPPPCDRPLRLVGEWSVVRLADGRCGVKRPYSLQPGIALVRLDDGTDCLLPKTMQVQLLARPEDLAAAYVQAVTRRDPPTPPTHHRPPGGSPRFDTQPPHREE